MSNSCGCWGVLLESLYAPPTHTHTLRRLLPGMEGQSHFIMLIRSIYQEHIVSVGKDADDDMT